MTVTVRALENGHRNDLCFSINSLVTFHSFLYVYQRVSEPGTLVIFPWGFHQDVHGISWDDIDEILMDLMD